jgi:hypothetical protein
MHADTMEVPATTWLARFEGLLRETMPYLRHVAPELSEETLLQLGSRLVELRLGGPLPTDDCVASDIRDSS